MHILFDNLIAAIIGVFLILTLVTASVRHRQVATEAMVFYGATSQTESFLQTLRRDLQGIAEVHTPTEDAASHTYSFDARIGTDPTMRTISYKREYVGVRHGQNVYRIRRFVDGAEEGGSGDIIKAWSVTTLNEQGQAISGVSSLGSARQISVSLETTSLLGEMTLDTGLSWSSVFFPPLLNASQLI
jgi:hypothetical protein